MSSVWRDPSGDTEYKAINNNQGYVVADGVFNPLTKVQISTLTVDKSQVRT